MAIDDHGNLAIGETMKLAWQDVLAYWKQGLLLILAAHIPGIVTYASGFAGTLYDPATSSLGTIVPIGLLTFVAIILFTCALYVLFIRLFLVGPSHAFRLSFGDLAGASLRFLWRGILIFLLLMFGMLVLLIPIVLVMAIVGVVMGVGADMVGPSSVVQFLPAILMTAFWIIVLVRLYPSLFGVTVGQSIRFKESWRTMDGYTWRTFLALIPPMLVSWVPQIVLWAFMIPQFARGPEAVLRFYSNLWWFWLLMVPFSYVSYGWAVATLSQLYRDMWPAPGFMDTQSEQPDTE